MRYGVFPSENGWLRHISDSQADTGVKGVSGNILNQ